MNLYSFLHVSVLLLVSISQLCFGAVAAKPNVILAMADDQGWGDMAYNGHPVLKTPVFDQMAARGLRFDRFYAAAPVCSPTRGSVLTGRHPNRFGCFQWGYSLRPQEVTIAEALKGAGYRTGHFGKWHLGSVRADSPVSPGRSGFDQWLSSPNFFEISPWMSRNGRAVKTEGEGSQVIVQEALRFIRSAHSSGAPFLAVIWFGSPHSPHEALARDLALYADQPEKLQAFLGEITAMDRAMGLLRSELRKLGIARQTLLWYTSDNGAIAEGSTGGLSGRKGSLWEGGLRVPALMEWPARIGQPRRTAVPAGTVDILPTLLELAGLSAEGLPPLDGLSLVPLIEGKMESRSKPLGFWDYPARGQPVRSSELVQEMEEEQRLGRFAPAHQKPPSETGLLTERYPEDEFPGHSAWIDGDFKLHRIPLEGGSGFQYSLFDLNQDPQEKIDLIERESSRAERMKTELLKWLHSVVASLNGRDYLGP